ncbi:DUF1796 family putative cysteine peptidase [Falsiroseomonas selenitidurans]|uniref:Papain-like cysteine peptidase n=1 Tax=Falsiroseomonas selenitidurans TaxID=2716335 RepID=A0ABX1E3F8_9PROT|nr:DUF1796 family putative cysteine peptidase [Falsiroseomonas selenitidurans]NKC31709.1 hypothetical protein [Falsiroseomonas selenitidurans]
MHDPDLVFSLGPNCRNTWNLRHHFETDRAYPFDWWITPAKSMLALLEPGFRFQVAREDLAVTEPADGTNSVYNRRLNLLHHHDFDRDGALVRPIAEAAIERLNAKYTALFARLWADLARAERPLAVLNGSFGGWPGGTPDGGSNPALNGFLAPRDLVAALRGRLGAKLRVVVVEIGKPRRLDLDGGTVIRLPDSGARLPNLPPGQGYAEPVHIFQEAFAALGLKPGPLGLREDAAASLAISNNTPRVRLA